MPHKHTRTRARGAPANNEKRPCVPWFSPPWSLPTLLGLQKFNFSSLISPASARRSVEINVLKWKTISLRSTPCYAFPTNECDCAGTRNGFGEPEHQWNPFIHFSATVAPYSELRYRAFCSFLADIPLPADLPAKKQESKERGRGRERERFGKRARNLANASHHQARESE